MRFSIVSILTLTRIASAGLVDPKACDGKGACVSNSACAFQFISEQSTNEAAYNCGSAGIVNIQESASATLAFRGGINRLTTVSEADFPICDIAQPGPHSVLLKHVANDITVFGFINYNCGQAAPTENTCWRETAGENTGSAIVCKVYRKDSPCLSVTDAIWSNSSCPTN